MLGLGAVAVAKNTLERAAVLFGAAERLLQNIEADLEPFNQVLYDQAKAQLQIKLDPTNYATLWRVGRGLTLQETVNFALNCDGYPDYNQQIPKNSLGVPKAS